ncbi:MAG: hypothetical protein DRP54_05330 [Spirochaetes bacterium]|nr:MAG: hypothetical protein DRP54_05330 [Spirochaetota bacterium]
MIYTPYIGNAVSFFFILSLIGLIFYFISRKPHKKDKEKQTIYICGEDMKPEKLNIPPETFYRYLINLFKLKKLRKWHSGNLNDYLLWILAGLVAVIIIMVMLW